MKNAIWKVFLFIIPIIVGLGLAGIAQNIKFEKYTLPNGLKVILHSDSTVPVVSVSVLYHVGSKNEDPSRTGFAHFFEHLLFEGSKNIKRGEFDKYTTKAGADNNANTSADRTYYFELLPSNQLGLGLWLESERMMHANILQEGVETQRQVVKEEKRLRVDAQPYGTIFENVLRYSFPSGSYQWSTIGSMEHLNVASLDEFMQFYRKFYVPNNAVLSIAGDLDIPETKKAIEAYFGEIPKGAEIERPSTTHEPLKAEVRQTIYDNIQLAAVIQSFRGPAQGTQDDYAFQLLAKILSGGESSRMNKELVDKSQISANVGSFSNSMENAGVFVCYAFGNVGVNPEKLELAMDTIIFNFKERLVSDRELQKVLNQTEKAFYAQNATMAGIAESLANYEVYFGDANLVNNEMEKYRKVTKQDILHVAQKYLNTENRVVLTYLPKSAEQKN